MRLSSTSLIYLPTHPSIHLLSHSSTCLSTNPPTNSSICLSTHIHRGHTDLPHSQLGRHTFLPHSHAGRHSDLPHSQAGRHTDLPHSQGERHIETYRDRQTDFLYKAPHHHQLHTMSHIYTNSGHIPRRTCVGQDIPVYIYIYRGLLQACPRETLHGAL